MNCLEVSSVDRWLHEFVKWKHAYIQFSRPTLVGGSDRTVILAVSTWRSNDLLLPVIDTTIMTCLLPSIAKTCIHVASLVFHVLSSLLETTCRLVWCVFLINSAIIEYTLTKELRALPWVFLDTPSQMVTLKLQ